MGPANIEGKDDHPASIFKDANAYARCTGKRLPTEAEWVGCLRRKFNLPQ